VVTDILFGLLSFLPFVSCFSLYAKTKKEFQKQEKIFLKEFKQMQTEKIETVKEKEALSGSPIF